MGHVSLTGTIFALGASGFRRSAWTSGAMDLDGIYFDAGAVALDLAFIESLTLTKSTKSGRPELMRLLPPHRKLVANLLGWKRADGTRLYRRAYFSPARK